MNPINDLLDQEVIAMLRRGAVGVIRTDTIYGIVGRADDEQAVERIYDLKNRDGDKSPIVLVSSVDDLFDEPTAQERALLDGVWPGKVSVIIPARHAPPWLERGNGSVAYRLPADETLRSLVAQTGPLIAPSANLQGEKPAESVEEAIRYFGENVDFYVDGGTVEDPTPSQLLRLREDGEVERLR
jgi:L-threonylcarbamoyladenylate synthase